MKEKPILYELIVDFYFNETLLIPKGTKKIEKEWCVNSGDCEKQTHIFKKVIPEAKWYKILTTMWSEEDGESSAFSISYIREDKMYALDETEYEILETYPDKKTMLNKVLKNIS